MENNSDCSKEETLKRMMYGHKVERDRIQEMLDFDLIVFGHCCYETDDEGKINYVDPLSPEVLKLLQSKLI